jgi:hypothetical protein
MMDPAKTIIALCGGFKAVAVMVQRSEVRVRRWTYTPEKGGTGGLIPSDCQQRLLDEARRQGLPLTPDHFFIPTPSSAKDAA